MALVDVLVTKTKRYWSPACKPAGTTTGPAKTVGVGLTHIAQPRDSSRIKRVIGEISHAVDPYTDVGIRKCGY